MLDAVAEEYTRIPSPTGKLPGDETVGWSADREGDRPRRQLPSRKETRQSYRRYLERLDVSTSVGKKPKHVCKTKPESDDRWSTSFPAGPRNPSTHKLHEPQVTSDRALQAVYHPANILRLRNAAQRRALGCTPQRNHFIDDVSSDDEHSNGKNEPFF
jgi:hypothetical protein